MGRKNYHSRRDLTHTHSRTCLVPLQIPWRENIVANGSALLPSIDVKDNWASSFCNSPLRHEDERHLRWTPHPSVITIRSNAHARCSYRNFTIPSKRPLRLRDSSNCHLAQHPRRISPKTVLNFLRESTRIFTIQLSRLTGRGGS